MSEKKWPKLRELWIELEKKLVERRKLTNEINELKERISIFVHSGDDPADDGQVEIFPPKPDVPKKK